MSGLSFTIREISFIGGRILLAGGIFSDTLFAMMTAEYGE